MKGVIPVLQVIVAILLMLSVLLQNPKATGLGGTIGGGGDMMGGYRRRRGFERKLLVAAFILLGFFMLLSILAEGTIAKG